MLNNRVLAIGGTLLGLAAGSAAGYLVAKHRLEAKYAQLASDEIAKAKDYYRMLNKQGEYATPGQVLDRRIPQRPGDLDDSVIDLEQDGLPVKDLKRIVEHLRYQPAGIVVQDPRPPVSKNIFDTKTDDDEEDPEGEDGEANITIISVREFMAGDLGHEQITLTYFAEDDVLADDGDMPVEDVEATVGKANLDRFGFRSRDPKVVYIRNKKLHTDFEVCHHEGSYAESVHGIVQERPKEKVRKMPRE